MACMYSVTTNLDPLFGSPRSIYFEIFGPPGPYISEIYGPSWKMWTPSKNFCPSVHYYIIDNTVILHYKLWLYLHTMAQSRFKQLLQVNFTDGSFTMSWSMFKHFWWYHSLHLMHCTRGPCFPSYLSQGRRHIQKTSTFFLFIILCLPSRLLPLEFGKEVIFFSSKHRVRCCLISVCA